ncbi:MAG: TIGR03936 family radical SAM-associated protein [Lachnospiraceae bacterium]|nr:TIGR03936 family radical SAM-associated protein [Lachnospiraceae bacterium]
MKIRIKFSKHGVLKYIGHLDLMRYFQKAFRRTDINVSYSSGYSPHMIMSFAHPLGVGLESDGEYFDVELDDDESPEDIKRKLNEVMAEGIEILAVTVLGEKAGNAMASVAAADYDIVFTEKCPFNEATIERFKGAEEILFTKETKKSTKTFNIKEFVFSLSIKDDKTLSFCVDASSSGNLKPKFLVDSLFSLDGIEECKYHVFRKEIYQRDKDGKFIPLEVSLDE